MLNSLPSLSEIRFKWLLFTEFNIDAQLEFVKLLNSFSSSGLSIKQSLGLTKESYSYIYGSSSIYCLMCDKLIDSIASVEGYTHILQKYFHPNIAVSYELMRFTTDKSAVSEVAELISFERKLIKDSIGSLFSPVMIFIAGAGVLAVLGKTAIPKMLERATSKGARIDEYPIEIDIALTFGNAVSSYGVFFAIFLVFLYKASLWLLPNLVPDTVTKSKIRNVLDRQWPFSLFKSIWSVRCMKLYGILKKADTRDLEILRLLKLFSPPFCVFYLSKMEQGFREGKPKREYFLKGLISKPQEVRLSPYFTHSSSKDFAINLIDISNQAPLDIDMQFRAAVRKLSLYLIVVGAVLFLTAIGSVFEMSNFII